MKTIFILYLWSVVAGSSGTQHRDWVDKGLYASEIECRVGARVLGVKSDSYRCIDSGIPIKTEK